MAKSASWRSQGPWRFNRGINKIKLWKHHLKNHQNQKEKNFYLRKRVSLSLNYKQGNFICGQTCLDMLGYDGHNMFPKNEVSSSDLRSIPGAQEVTVPVGQEETLDYTYPHIWILLGKDKVAGAQHWVIKHGSKIYCPTVGAMNSDEYKNKYVAFILQEFVIPFKGQKYLKITTNNTRH